MLCDGADFPTATVAAMSGPYSRAQGFGRGVPDRLRAGGGGKGGKYDAGDKGGKGYNPNPALRVEGHHL